MPPSAPRSTNRAKSPPVQPRLPSVGTRGRPSRVSPPRRPTARPTAAEGHWPIAAAPAETGGGGEAGPTEWSKSIGPSSLTIRFRPAPEPHLHKAACRCARDKPRIVHIWEQPSSRITWPNCRSVRGLPSCHRPSEGPRHPEAADGRRRAAWPTPPRGMRLEPPDDQTDNGG